MGAVKLINPTGTTAVDWVQINTYELHVDDNGKKKMASCRQAGYCGPRNISTVYYIIFTSNYINLKSNHI